MTNALSLSVPNTLLTYLTSVPVGKIAEYGMHFYTYKYAIFFFFFLQYRIRLVLNLSHTDVNYYFKVTIGKTVKS